MALQHEQRQHGGRGQSHGGPEAWLDNDVVRGDAAHVDRARLAVDDVFNNRQTVLRHHLAEGVADLGGGHRRIALIGYGRSAVPVLSVEQPPEGEREMMKHLLQLGWVPAAARPPLHDALAESGEWRQRWRTT